MRPASLLGFALLGLVSCRSLFWSDAEEFYEAYWLDETRVVESFLFYREKYPFPPIAVTTTLKKNYKTSLCTVTVRRDDSVKECAKRIEVEGQQINGAYLMGSTFVILVVRDPEAPENRALLGVDLVSGKSKTLLELPVGGWTAASISASPDRTKLAILWQKAEEARLSISDGLPGSPVSDPPGIALPVTGRVAQVVWAVDSDKVFVPRDSDVLEISRADGRWSAGPARKFPRCFEPPTRYAGRISDGGRTYMREGVRLPPKIGVENGYKPFHTLPYTEKFDEIGAGCR